MKELKSQILLYISETLMSLAYRLAPSGEEGHDIRTYIHAYFTQKGCDSF